MAAAELTVRRLRLAPRGAGAHANAQPSICGVAARIADALRVSSKPATLLHRLVLVRRLRLRAAPGASAQTLALLLERAWLRIAAEARPIETASDASAAVWASSATAARAELLARWLRGEATDAWFWQRIASSACEGAWPQRALALMHAPLPEVAAATTASGVQPAADPALVRALLAVVVRHGAQEAFVDAIDDAQAAALLCALDGLGVAPHPSRPRTAGVMTEFAAAPAAAARARLLAAINAGSASRRPSSHDTHAAQRGTPVATGRGAVARDAPLSRAAGVPAARGPARPEGHLPPAAMRDGTVLVAASMGHGAESAWAGLWLMLPMLLRHGLVDADDPLTAWTGALRAACVRFRVADDDPVHAAIASLEPPMAAAGDHWLRVARRAAAHEARLPLRRVARRRGAAWLSSERIDVEFPASSVDVRIRRAGFDIDPGFVPWLGRSVHFHYA